MSKHGRKINPCLVIISNLLVLETIEYAVLKVQHAQDRSAGAPIGSTPQFYARLFNMFIPSYKTTDLAHCWSDSRARSFVQRKFYCSCFTRNMYYHVDYEVFFWSRGIVR